MTNMEVVQLDIQLETAEMETEIAEIRDLLEDLTNVASRTRTAISDALTPDIDSLSDAQATFQDMADDLDLAVAKMGELVTLMKPQEESWCEGALAGVDGFNTLVDGLGNVENLSKAINKGIDKAVETKQDFNIFKALAPNSLDLASSFDDIATKIKASTSATWLQNAAAIAWQGISSAATAVTTAFGAAMSFLTSPIGLVVLAIVALIAIIALLIANWDTVKAAVLTAWEAIKGALATAADWFNTNVIQPVVGFFKTAFEWVSTKLQAGFAFVQSIFAGISSFMQGVFAKDWTEQFGAFGNVLNAFFANVANIWNAVKGIFNGIVGFIKNVFAGDCRFSEVLFESRISES